jgi:hypothetical protein
MFRIVAESGTNSLQVETPPMLSRLQKRALFTGETDNTADFMRRTEYWWPLFSKRHAVKIISHGLGKPVVTTPTRPKTACGNSENIIIASRLNFSGRPTTA